MNPLFNAHIELRRIFAEQRARTPVQQVLSCVSSRPALSGSSSALDLQSAFPSIGQVADPFSRFPKGA